MSVLRRLFFGLEMEAPWPKNWPKGRVLDTPHRHATLQFLGNCSVDRVVEALPTFPLPDFVLGPCGFFNRSLELPKENPRVIAWHIDWGNEDVSSLQKSITQWLLINKFPADQRQWLSHLTICRDPVDLNEWSHFFKPIPCFAKALHLYESLGSSRYRPLWSHLFSPPFKEIEHTADIAFHIFGKDLTQIFQHAYLALAFQFPKMEAEGLQSVKFHSLDDVIILLNEIIGKTDRLIGCPFKAVSFHGEIKPWQNTLIQWEMIVDV